MLLTRKDFGAHPLLPQTFLSLIHRTASTTSGRRCFHSATYSACGLRRWLPPASAESRAVTLGANVPAAHHALGCCSVGRYVYGYSLISYHQARGFQGTSVLHYYDNNNQRKRKPRGGGGGGGGGQWRQRDDGSTRRRRDGGQSQSAWEEVPEGRGAGAGSQRSTGTTVTEERTIRIKDSTPFPGTTTTAPGGGTGSGRTVAVMAKQEEETAGVAERKRRGGARLPFTAVLIDATSVQAKEYFQIHRNFVAGKGTTVLQRYFVFGPIPTWQTTAKLLPAARGQLQEFVVEPFVPIALQLGIDALHILENRERNNVEALCIIVSEASRAQQEWDWPPPTKEEKAQGADYYSRVCQRLADGYPGVDVHLVTSGGSRSDQVAHETFTAAHPQSAPPAEGSSDEVSSDQSSLPLVEDNKEGVVVDKAGTDTSTTADAPTATATEVERTPVGSTTNRVEGATEL